MNPYKKASIVFVGIIFTFSTRFILFGVLIPDECAYHNGKESGLIINLFYELTASNGYHPAPNLLNNIVTFSLGTILGFYFSFLLALKNKKLLN